MHQLRGLFHRVQDPHTETQKESEQIEGDERVCSRGWNLADATGADDSCPNRSEAGSERPPTKQEEEAPAADGKNAFGYRSNRMAVDGMPVTTLSDQQVAEQASQNNTYAQFMKPKFARAPIKEAGRVAYLGESSNLSLLVQDRHGTTDVVHYPLPPNIHGSRSRLTDLDNLELDILHQRGAFLLPPKPLCDELVEAYFKWVAPVVPIVNRSRFMRHYRDPKNPPSLLLLQAILLAGSRVCTNPQLMDANGSTTPAAMTFYKRAKALYDANYEDDRVTIVQALVLLGWYWEGPEGGIPMRMWFEDVNGADSNRCHEECVLLDSGGHGCGPGIRHASEV